MPGSKRVKAREQADLKQNGGEQQWLRIEQPALTWTSARCAALTPIQDTTETACLTNDSRGSNTAQFSLSV